MRAQDEEEGETRSGRALGEERNRHSMLTGDVPCGWGMSTQIACR